MSDITPQKTSFYISMGGLPGAGPLVFNINFGSITFTKAFKVNRIYCFGYYVNLTPQTFLVLATRLSFTYNPQQVVLGSVPQGTAVGGSGSVPLPLNINFTPNDPDIQFDNFVIAGSYNIAIAAQVWNSVAFGAADTVSVDVIIEGEYL